MCEKNATSVTRVPASITTSIVGEREPRTRPVNPLFAVIGDGGAERAVGVCAAEIEAVRGLLGVGGFGGKGDKAGGGTGVADAEDEVWTGGGAWCRTWRGVWSVAGAGTFIS